MSTVRRCRALARRLPWAGATAAARVATSPSTPGAGFDLAPGHQYPTSALDALTRIVSAPGGVRQPPPAAHARLTLHAAIASLALGGAERIVLDWAAAASRPHRVRLVVLRSARAEWRVPESVEVVRLPESDRNAALEREGERIAASGNPVVLCHLLTRDECAALDRGGAMTIAVLHNARAGWIDPAGARLTSAPLIAVSRAAARDALEAGARHVNVLRHLPRPRARDPRARATWRERWDIPADAFVIGMVGGVKPQKAYPRALHILGQLRTRQDAWLVVLGGPTGRDGALAWAALVQQAIRLRLEERVRLPGFVTDAADALPAFDLLLNTSRYEGLSIATLEALAAGLPVVASRVGGQGEITAPGLHLLAFDAPPAAWADAIARAPVQPCVRPAWLGFPSERLWTLAHLPPARIASTGTLFVTANLNAGGAQRSLVNLAAALAGKLAFQVAVCGDSTASPFIDRLARTGVSVWRTAGSRDCFDHAEAILRHVATCPVRNVVFWNVDAKVKLLVTKLLAPGAMRIVDVSPGAYAFEEMDATRDFQTWVAYSAQEYHARLDRLVLKYRGPAPVGARTSVIPNGVPAVAGGAPAGERPLRRVVVSGRIAPTKFLLEIAAAMTLVWAETPDAQLHVLGTAQPRDEQYARAFLGAVGPELDRRVFLHGESFDAPRRLAQFDVALVIGHHQGSPNAVLEAMAAGLVVVANDSGGTRELVRDGRTGVLLSGREPQRIAAGLLRVMGDAHAAARMASAARARVARRYSMRAMVAAYLRLLR